MCTTKPAFQLAAPDLTRLATVVTALLVSSALLPCSAGEEEERRTMDREAKVLLGVVEHILPRVRGHVQTLDLAYGRAVSNEMVRASAVGWESWLPCMFL